MAHSMTEIDIPLPPAESGADTGDVVIPKRPEPTPEQARLGIMPAARGNGTFQNVRAWVRSVPHFDGSDEEFKEFERVIAEERAIRRSTAEEKDL